MCTVVLLRRSSHRWPIVIGANRDEMNDRPWLPPSRHWPDRPDVVGGLDKLAMGSWLGVNDDGVVAAILNREGTLGPLPGKRSRGELVLEALDHSDAVESARALAGLDAGAYRAFNMIVADNRDAYWIRADGRTLRVVPIGEGVFMLTAREMNDPTDQRIQHFLPLFNRAPLPDPENNDWCSWRTLFTSPAPQGAESPNAGLEFQMPNGFGTRNSSFLALPSVDHPEVDPVWLFSPGPPSEAHYRPVAL